MGRIAEAVKATIRLGGTGVPFTTSRANDVVYIDLDNVPGGRVAGINITAGKAMSYIPFFAAVRNISEDIAGLPLGVYRKVDGARQQQSAHPLHTLLHDAPNPYMSAFTFRETLQSHALTWGNGYAEIEYATDGSVLALWPLRPDRMEVLVDEQGNRPLYRYTLSGGGRTVDLPWEKVFHLHGLGFDGLKGYSIIAIARGMLGVALAGEKHAQTDLGRGTVPPAVLKTEKVLSAEAKKNIRESWDSIDHRDRVAILEEGLDLKEIGVSARDSQFIQTMDLPRSLMATLMRIAPSMLQDVDRSTSWGSGIAQQSQGYVTFTLRSHLLRWEGAANLQLLTDEYPDRYVKHTVDALLRGDPVTRWQTYEAGLRSGVYCIDDVLEMEDRNPLPDGAGQMRRVPLNFAPLDQFTDATLKDRVEMLGQLVRAGFDPAGAAEAVSVPQIEHTGLEPVTVTEQGDF